MTSAPIPDEYVWRFPDVVLLDLERGWESRGFSTRLSRVVTFRESWGQRSPRAWRPSTTGDLFVSLDELWFVASTQSMNIRQQNVAHWHITSGCPDYRGRAVADSEQLIVHERSGSPTSLGWGGSHIGRVLTDVLGREGTLFDLTIAFVEGPERRSSLADRMPHHAEVPSQELTHAEVLELDYFWGGENLAAQEESTAVEAASLNRSDLSDRLQLVRRYHDLAEHQLVLVDREMQRRSGDAAFVRAQQDRLNADNEKYFGPGGLLDR